MYLHLGTGAVVRTDSIIGVFDLDNTSQSHLTRRYLAAAEKSGQVSGQRVDKSLPLCAALIRFQHAEIVTKIIHSQRTQTTDQAVVNHVPLVVRQHDPRTLVD